MNKLPKYFVVFAAFAVLALGSCKEKTPADIFPAEKGTYFSIKKFTLDEWETHAGEPISFLKTVTEGGKTDSSFVNIEHVDWVDVLKTFTETDISDKSFLGQYSFSQFEDSLDNTHNFLYLANNKELFTQKLLITMDVNTMKLRGVYIETFKKTFWNERQQKLFYSPVEVIQVQQYDKPLVGSRKEKVVKYVAVTR